MSFFRNWCDKRPTESIKEKFLSVQLEDDVHEIDLLLKTLRNKIWYRNAKSKCVGPLMMITGLGYGWEAILNSAKKMLIPLTEASTLGQAQRRAS